MSKIMDGSDYELHVRGIHVHRSQFNTLYHDLSVALNAIQQRTGVRPVIPDLGKRVYVSERDYCISMRSDVHRGMYLGQTNVAVKCLRNISKDNEKAKKVSHPRFAVVRLRMLTSYCPCSSSLTKSRTGPTSRAPTFTSSSAYRATAIATLLW